MRAIVLLTAFTAAAGFFAVAGEAEAQSTRRTVANPRVVYINPAPPRARITVRRARSYLDAGTEVGPMTKSYTDYAVSPLDRPYRNYDPTETYRSPLPDSFRFPGYW